MNELITINNYELPVRMYNGQRVVTFQDVATLYEVPVKNIQNNFYNNREWFKEGTDYFALKRDDLTQLDWVTSKETPSLLVFTAHGFILLAKPIQTQNAWSVYVDIIDRYFQLRELIFEQYKFYYPSWTHIYPFFPKQIRKVIEYRGETCKLSIEETAKLMDLDIREVRDIERMLFVFGYESPNWQKDRTFSHHPSQFAFPEDKWGEWSIKELYPANKDDLKRNLLFKVDEIGLDTRAVNALRDNGILLVADLVRKQPRELLKLNGVGDGVVSDIRDILDKMGLFLGMYIKDLL